MKDVLVSFCIFGSVVFFHAIWHRASQPKGFDFKVLTVLAFLGFLLKCWLSKSLGDIEISGATIWQIRLSVSSVLLYVLLILNYLMFYCSLLIDSPSRLILRLLKVHKSLDYDRLQTFLKDSRFIETRLQALVESGCVRNHGKYYGLTHRGRRIGRTLSFYQEVTGRSMGG